MRCNPTMLFGFLAVTGCAATPSAPAVPASTAAPEPVAATAEPPDAPATPSETLAEAEAVSRSQLGASRAGQFELDRQVAELRRAILLYQKFLDLADGRPELEPAVLRSRAAIEDLRATLVFLLQERDAPGEPPQPERR
jgi:hypothetical protein